MMYCVQSFYVDCEPEYDTFAAFKDQHNDLLHAFALASISVLPSLSHESLPYVPSY